MGVCWLTRQTVWPIHSEKEVPICQSDLSDNPYYVYLAVTPMCNQPTRNFSIYIDSTIQSCSGSIQPFSHVAEIWIDST